MALIPKQIAIPDHEHGTVQHVEGHTLTAGDRTLGSLYYGGEMWCWIAATGDGFGRSPSRRECIAHLVDGALR